MDTPKQVKRVLKPGLWIEDNEIHLDPKPFLEHLGYTDTEENRVAVIAAMKRFCREQWPQAPIVDVFDREPPLE